jgi:hypothetical protein
MDLKDDRLAILLSQNEVRCIMGLLGAQSLVGIDASLLAGAAPKAGRRSLLARKLLQASPPGKGDQIRGDLLQLAVPVLFPDRALVVVRTIPKVGAQTLVFLHRGPTTVLHSMPQNDVHRLIGLETPADGIRTLTEWFPFEGYAGSPANAIILSGNLDRFRNYAETGRDQAALKAIADVPMPPEEKLLFLRTIKEPTVSGSFALFTTTGNSVSSAESLAVIADRSVAWAITSPDGNLRKKAYRVRRTGEDLPSIFRNMFAWLGNGKID